jgi:hypothetical protein
MYFAQICQPTLVVEDRHCARGGARSNGGGSTTDRPFGGHNQANGREGALNKDRRSRGQDGALVDISVGDSAPDHHIAWLCTGSRRE